MTTAMAPAATIDTWLRSRRNHENLTPAQADGLARAMRATPGLATAIILDTIANPTRDELDAIIRHDPSAPAIIGRLLHDANDPRHAVNHASRAAWTIRQMRLAATLNETNGPNRTAARPHQVIAFIAWQAPHAIATTEDEAMETLVDEIQAMVDNDPTTSGMATTILSLI